MNVSEFKAVCLRVLERVRQTGQPLEILKNGQPLAVVYPPSTPGRRAAFGALDPGPGNFQERQSRGSRCDVVRTNQRVLFAGEAPRLPALLDPICGIEPAHHWIPIDAERPRESIHDPCAIARDPAAVAVGDRISEVYG